MGIFLPQTIIKLPNFLKENTWTQIFESIFE